MSSSLLTLIRRSVCLFYISFVLGQIRSRWISQSELVSGANDIGRSQNCRTHLCPYPLVPSMSSLSFAMRSRGSVIVLIRYSRSPPSWGSSRKILYSRNEAGTPTREGLKSTAFPTLSLHDALPIIAFLRE